jgi:hypothetical protein
MYPKMPKIGPKPLLDTQFRFWSSGFTSNHSFHIAKLITHIVSITVQMQLNQPFTITFNYDQMGDFDTIFNKIKTISHTNLLTKPNSHFRFQFDSATESDHLMRAIAGAMQNCNWQLLQCHFY